MLLIHLPHEASVDNHVIYLPGTCHSSGRQVDLNPKYIVCISLFQIEMAKALEIFSNGRQGLANQCHGSWWFGNPWNQGIKTEHQKWWYSVCLPRIIRKQYGVRANYLEPGKIAAFNQTIFYLCCIKFTISLNCHLWVFIRIFLTITWLIQKVVVCMMERLLDIHNWPQ